MFSYESHRKSQKGRNVLTQERTEYLTVEEASVRTHISSATIRRAIKSGALVYRAQKERTRLLSADEVDAWVRTRTELRKLDDGGA